MNPLRSLLLLAIALPTGTWLIAQTVSPPLFNAFEHDDDGDGIVDEFDDHPTDIDRSFDTVTPRRTESGRLAFEADWPQRGDDDFNDVVLGFRTTETADAEGDIVALTANLDVLGVDADVALGVAIRTTVPLKLVADAELTHNSGRPVGIFPPRGAVTAVYRIADDVSASTGDDFELRFTLTQPVSRLKLGDRPIEFFVFHTDDPGREIHLPNQPPSELADPTWFGTFDDTTDPLGSTYLSEARLPWALELPVTWRAPLEGVDLATAYPAIIDWIESSGSAEADWYMNPDMEEVQP